MGMSAAAVDVVDQAVVVELLASCIPGTRGVVTPVKH